MSSPQIDVNFELEILEFMSYEILKKLKYLSTTKLELIPLITEFDSKVRTFIVVNKHDKARTERANELVKRVKICLQSIIEKQEPDAKEIVAIHSSS